MRNEYNVSREQAGDGTLSQVYTSRGAPYLYPMALRAAEALAERLNEEAWRLERAEQLREAQVERAADGW